MNFFKKLINKIIEDRHGSCGYYRHGSCGYYFSQTPVDPPKVKLNAPFQEKCPYCGRFKIKKVKKNNKRFKKGKK